jgi:4-amino-4-deoxy-L-arabinose transferase-like glycosyltransferase
MLFAKLFRYFYEYHHVVALHKQANFKKGKLIVLCEKQISTMPAEYHAKRFDALFHLLLIIAIGLNATVLFNEIVEPDSALYAGIAKRITLSNDWINLYADGYDWLDKPHFPFWMAALSFKWFGINAFAYKLPAFLFWLAGLRFTWLLTRSIFGKQVAQLSVIIYSTALHVVISNFDVRAEPYLTCCVVAATYYIYLAEKNGKIIHVLLAALFIACAVMTKGIFIIFTIAGGFVIYWILKKDWKQFISYKWWLLLLFTVIFILPELYCLYVQFDLHPEKIIFGKTNVSGIQFFFWDSQFGRFFNSGPIKGKGDYFFFLHTTVWAFLPWSFILFAAVFMLIRRKIQTQKIHMVIYGSAAITFLLFSLSKFQLPHYIVIIFPHLSIITGVYLHSVRGQVKAIRNIVFLQSILLGLAALLLTGLIILYRYRFGYAGAALVVTGAVAVIVFFRKPLLENILIKNIAFAALLYLFLNIFFYPHLLKYQAGMMAGKWIKENNIKGPFAIYRNFSYSFEFYAPGIVMQTDDKNRLKEFASGTGVLIYTSKENIKELTDEGYSIMVLQTFSYFPVSKLNLKFLNYKTRQAQLQEIILAKISKKVDF